MDQDDEIKKFKLMLVALAAFLASGYYSYQEIKYMIWGETTQANVTGTSEVINLSKRGRGKPLLGVEYTYTETAGKTVNEKENLPLDTKIENGTLEIQYLSGVAGSSRHVGKSRLFTVFIFLGCLTWLGFMGFKLAKEANEPMQVQRRRR